ncbi:MAG: TRAP transporter large permease [candidate division WOR-3 bacterium]
MEPYAVGILGIIFVLIGLLLAIPIAAILAIVSFLGIWVLSGWDVGLNTLGLAALREAASWDFAAVALFIAIGAIATRSGMANDLFDALSSWFGEIKAGLMVATTLAAAFFGACCGTTIASCMLFGKLAAPRMIERGYNPSWAVGLIATSGTLAALIPPSAILILYGILTQQSIAHLFIGTLVPGVMTAALYVLIIVVAALVKPDIAPTFEKVSWKKKVSALKRSWGLPLVGLFIITSLYTGIATPTEVAAIGACFTAIVALLYKGWGRADLWSSFVETAVDSAMVLLIVIAAKLFGRFLTMTELTPVAMNFVQKSGLPREGVLLFIIFLYLVAGCVMDSLSMAVISIPVVYPIITGLGYDPVWFGVVLAQLVEIGVITPPVGMNVFVTKSVVGDVVTLSQVFRTSMVFLLGNVVVLVLVLVFPNLVLWLPSRM